MMSTHQADLISVIIPARNTGAWIARTLETVVGQSYRNLEIVVVDDGSTDDTGEIAGQFVRRDSRVTLHRGAGRGSAAARNLAIARSSGAFIAPCDSDDLWHPDKIARQLEAFRRAPGSVGVVYCWSAGIDGNDAVIFPYWARGTAEGDVLEAMIEDSLPGSGSAPLIRRSALFAAGGYPEDVVDADEWQLYIALAAQCRFAVVPDRLVAYRLRPGSQSSNFLTIEASLARTTRWIEATWPDLAPQVLRRRAHVVNCYLSFLAMRAGWIGKAFGYRAAAWKARPEKILDPATLGFLLLAVGETIGLRRYYYDFWRRPVPWQALIGPAGAGPDRPAARP
jgi:glycosyltransferase involved in cell wall biosynthesis